MRSTTINRALALVIGASALAAGCGDDGDGLLDEALSELESEGADETSTSSTTTAPETSTTASTTTAPTTTEQPTTTAPTTTGEPETTTTGADSGSENGCLYAGADFVGDMQVEISLTSTVESVTDLGITYTLTADSTSLLEETTFVEAVLPGEQLRIPDDTLTQVPAGVDESAISCEIDTIEEFGSATTETTPGGSDACEFVELDFADDIQIEIIVTNPFPDTTDIWVIYALRGPDDVRFGTGSTLIEAVPSGEQVTWPQDTLTGVPAWMGPADVTCELIAMDDFG